MSSLVNDDVAFGNTEVREEFPYLSHISSIGQASDFDTLVLVLFINKIRKSNVSSRALCVWLRSVRRRKIMIIILCDRFIVAILDSLRLVGSLTSAPSAAVMRLVWMLLLRFIAPATASTATSTAPSRELLAPSWLVAARTVAVASLGTVEFVLELRGEVFVLLLRNLEQLNVPMANTLFLSFSERQLRVVAAIEQDNCIASQLSAGVLADLDRVVLQSKPVEEFHNLVLGHAVGQAAHFYCRPQIRGVVVLAILFTCRCFPVAHCSVLVLPRTSTSLLS